MNSNIRTSFYQSKNECTHTFDVKVTLCYYYTEPLIVSTAYDKRSIFSVKQLSIKSDKSEKLF